VAVVHAAEHGALRGVCAHRAEPSRARGEGRVASAQASADTP
jgi:hypothetical protein